MLDYKGENLLSTNRNRRRIFKYLRWRWGGKI